MNIYFKKYETGLVKESLLEELNAILKNRHKEYYNFLAISSGGTFFDGNITIQLEKDIEVDDFELLEWQVDWFLSLEAPNQNSSSIFSLRRFSINEFNLNSFLPIAQEYTSNSILLNLDTGEIHYWDKQFSSVNNPDTIPKIADSFLDFCKILIDAAGGYIKNFSEIYEEILKEKN